ncbi:tail fiber assembly protein, partial [Enterobacter hormaechei]
MTEQYYYSFSAKGFFWLKADELNGNDIPGDLIPGSEEEHAALFLGLERGKYINDTPVGPAMVDQPDYLPEELIAQAE